MVVSLYLCQSLLFKRESCKHFFFLTLRWALMDFYEVHTIIFDYILDYDESTKPGYVRIRLRIPGIEPRAGGQLSKILSKDPKAKNVKFIGPVCDIR